MRLAVVVLLSLSACVLTPYSDTPVESTKSVGFSGFTSSDLAGGTVQVQYLRKSGWTTLGTATIDVDGGWSASVSVPRDAWTAPPCDYATFRFRGPSATTLYAFDARCVRAKGPNPPFEELVSCAVPTLKLFQGRTHFGDLALTGQAEADAQYCVTRVEGNVTLDGGAVSLGPGGVWAEGLAFDLPNLKEVTGNLTVDPNRTERLSLPALRTVGGDLTMTSVRFNAGHVEMGSLVAHRAVSVLDLPLLQSVGGAVTLSTVNVAGSSSGNVVHEFGLDALTSVGTDVAVHGVFLTAMQGLRGLTTIPRDLVFDWGNSDMDSTQLLSALTTVGRDATFTLPPNARHGLYALQTVTRDALIQPAQVFVGLRDEAMPALRTVGGQLTLSDVSSDCGDVALPGLETVTGTLTLSGRAPKATLGRTGATHLTLGGLAMTGTLLNVLPFHADVRVAGAGPVSFDGNANLCTCQIDGFTASLAAGGWAGVPVSSGNGGAASCAVCPGLYCP
ncbi:MAG: hypothetical protein U0229_13950 [Anaeromyxobacter sp.]